MESSALLLYRIIQLVLVPFVALYFLARISRNRSYFAHFAERFGYLPQSFTRTMPGAVWLHAVSVGEVASVLPLIRALRADQPRVPIYLSTSTVAGRKMAFAQASDLVDGIFYCPLDYIFAVRRVLRAIKPALLVILETEIWPNLYRETKRSGAQLAVVNARISDRTWPRYRRWKRWIQPVLSFPDLILAQSSTDLSRYLELGAPRDRVFLAPNLKYDASFSPVRMEADTFGAQQIWVAASTVGPNERGSLRKHSVCEEDIVVDAFEKLMGEFPKLLLILAPRQPARFDEVARKLQARGVRFLRRTAAKMDSASALRLPGILLLDTMGELSGVYRFADVAFVGGSLAPRGGHNILEPAAAGSPIVIGPHMENFSSIAQDFVAADAAIQILTAADLLPTVRGLLRDGISARLLGNRALELVTSRRESAREVAAQLWRLYGNAAVRTPHTVLSRAVLKPAAVLWRRGGAAKREKAAHFAIASKPIPKPIVSVGGITLGGSGKTPFTVYLADRLKARGFCPAILTRGYRRRSPAEHLIVPAGLEIPTAVTGDEAQIFLRAGKAPVGIGTKRYETAQILLRQFPSTDVLLLDDGFQHARLARDFDIVLIDGLDPFGGEEIVPLGRLREPLDALKRAHAFVVTRAEDDLRFQSVAQRLRLLNPSAPIFRTRLITRSWRDYREGRIVSVPLGTRVAAFCGLGNPTNFWQTLDSLGLQVVFRWTFPDHHSYTLSELQRLSHQARMHGADLLVTTEKDRINCPTHSERAIHPLNLVWLEIEFELEDESGFFSVLEEHCGEPRSSLAKANS